MTVNDYLIHFFGISCEDKNNCGIHEIYASKIQECLKEHVAISDILFYWSVGICFDFSILSSTCWGIGNPKAVRDIILGMSVIISQIE